MLKSRGPKTDPCRTPESTPRGKETTEEKKLRLPAGSVTTKPAYITTRKSKSIKLMKEQGMRDKVESTAKIEINSISLTMRPD
jgi:hypothetical protein